MKHFLKKYLEWKNLADFSVIFLEFQGYFVENVQFHEGQCLNKNYMYSTLLQLDDLPTKYIKYSEGNGGEK